MTRLRGAAHKRLFACGSMVLYRMFSIFALPSAKMENEENKKYRSAEG